MRRVSLLVLIWFSFTLLLYYVYSLAPHVEGEEKLRFPRDIDDLRNLVQIMGRLRAEKYSYMLLLFSLAFLYKQTFAIPGSFFMNLMAGALFGSLVGVPLVCFLTAIGASFCFLLSGFFAQSMVVRYLHNHLNTVRAKVTEEKDRLFFYLLSARVFPFTPHWLLNITSPFVGIPLSTHFLTVGLGLIPYNFLCVRAGCILSEIRSVGDVFDLLTMMELLATATVLFLLSRIAKRRAKV